MKPLPTQIQTLHSGIKSQYDGIIVSEERGTSILEDVINEFVTANKSENETENTDIKQQSGKADVTETDQDENKYTFSPFKHFLHQNESETNRPKDSEETLNATNSNQRTNQIPEFRHENSSEKLYVLDAENSNVSDLLTCCHLIFLVKKSMFTELSRRDNASIFVSYFLNKSNKGLLIIIKWSASCTKTAFHAL